MIQHFQVFLSDEGGQTLVEYGLLVSLLSLIVIAALTVLGRKTANTFDGVADGFPGGHKNGPPGPIGNPNQ